MNQDRLTGAAKNFGGKVEEGFGKVTGDASTEASGKMKQVEGELQDLYGRARETAGQAAEVVRETAGQAAEVVRKQASSFEETLRDTIETAPLHGGGGGAGGGLADRPHGPARVN